MNLSHVLAERTFFHLCEKLEVGGLTVTTSDGRRTFGQPHAALQAHLRIRDKAL